MINCPKCNAEIRDGMKFCPSCGTAIPQIKLCPKCGNKIADGMIYCSKCGTKVDDISAFDEKVNVDSNSQTDQNIKCPICGAPLSIDDKQCPNCHRNLFYKCNSCKHDITYGEIIKNKGCCPECGKQITSLYNIPANKYPYYIEAQVVGNESNLEFNQTNNNDGRTGKYSGPSVIEVMSFGHIKDNSCFWHFVLKYVTYILLLYAIFSSIGIWLDLYIPEFAFGPFVAALISCILLGFYKALGDSIFGGKITQYVSGFFVGFTIFFGVKTQFFLTSANPTGDPQKDAELLYKIYKNGGDDDKFLDDCATYYLSTFGGVVADDKLQELNDAMQPYMEKIKNGE